MTKKTTETKKKPKKKVEQAYTAEQIFTAKKYRNDVPLLRVLLEEDETYTLKQVDNQITKFKKGLIE